MDREVPVLPSASHKNKNLNGTWKGEIQMMTHIENAAARAEHLRQLERAMMLDPDPEYRAQAKAEYLKLTEKGK